MSDNVRQLLETRVAKYREKTFLFSETDDRLWSYAEFDAAVNKTANLLRSHQIKKGDVVSLLMPNSAEYIIAYFACWKIGAIAGPINSLLKPDEIAWAVSNSESKLVLAGSELARSCEGSVTEQWPPVAIFDDVVKATNGCADHLELVDLSTEDDAIIIYTSGTTGKPKGCLLTHGNLISNARQISEWMGFGESDRLLTVMPLFHMNAVSVTTMTALYSGGSAVISPKFSVSKFWDIIQKYQVTSFGSVATMLSMLLARYESGEAKRPAGASSLRFAMCGSAPVPVEVLNRFEQAFNCLVIEGYGLSESTCRSTFNPPNEARRPGSCGMPIGNEIKVVDENDVEVADGELGEIVLRGPNICKEYFKNPGATTKAFANGWFHTGDIGYRDGDGFFYIADRKSDMIIRGGENIYPREIDDLLYQHSAVESAAVVGVPDELYGEEVTAFVVLKPGQKPSQDDLIAFCQKHLADYKCPKTIHFVDEIPKGPTGKLLKRELAKLLVQTP
ncbi:MAG: class I adenylate-forming enzyme family protein [Pyrinomonadaceae bacterium]